VAAQRERSVRRAALSWRWWSPGAGRLGRALLRRVEYLLIPVALLVVVQLWKLVAYLGQYPEFILPQPESVARRFVLLASDGLLWKHTSLTVLESLLGFLVGLVFATAVGYLLAKSPLLEKLLSPYLVASQSIPIVAVAPLLVLWFGFGLTSKVVAAFIICFFPILINTIVGVRTIDPESRELMHTLSASPWQVFWKLEVPAALPVYLGGVRVGITLSVIGAVVGEFVGADQGLGYLISQSRGFFDTATMFVALLTLVAMALTLYLSVVGLERILLRSRRRG
jgi:NitT/TauT family transport system permease protein